MKKLFFLGMTLTMMVACTSETDELSLFDGEPAIDVDVPIMLSDIPIEFSTSLDATTRAAIESEEFNATDFGVFCLARKGIDGTSNNGLNWDNSSTSSANNRLCRYLFNEPASVTWDGSKSVMTWLDGQDGAHCYYYPGTGESYKYAYTFAAYRPMLSEENIQVNSNVIYLFFSGLDGSQDIMTAVTEEPDDQVAGKEGFSASYYKNGGQKKPYFDFKHRMSKLTFNVKLNSSYTGQQLWVDSLWIISVPDSIRLTLVTATKTAGTVDESSAVRILYGHYGTYFMRNSDDSYMSTTPDAYPLSTTNLELGSMLIPPMQKNIFYDGSTKISNANTTTNLMTLKVRIRLKDVEGNFYVYGASVAPPAKGWVASKSYPINLTLTPTGANTFSIRAEAGLADWEGNTDTFTSDYEIGD